MSDKGGGSNTSSVQTINNIPEHLRPQSEALIGAATQEYFQTEKGPDGKLQITGLKPFTPYSVKPEDYFAGFSPIQQQVQYEAANMQRPGQFGSATWAASQAGLGGAQTAEQALGYGNMGVRYGQTGQQAGALGQQLGVAGGGQYGGMGATYGAGAARLAPGAVGYGQQAAMTGDLYRRMATNPGDIAAYMSPYMQNVVDVQKQQAIQDYQQNIMPEIQAQAIKSGAFGGSRDAVQRAMAQRALTQQMQGLQATGLQKAYEDAQQAQQFGIGARLQGLQTGLQGLGAAGELYGRGMQGAQLGLEGVRTQLAGTQQGMEGAQLGMQGAGLGLQGVSGAQAGYDLLGRSGVNLANIGAQQQQADLERMGFQKNIGAEQQALEQAKIDQAVKQYYQARDYPTDLMAKYSALLHGYYTPEQTTSYYQNINPVSQAAGFVTAASQAVDNKAGGKIEDAQGIDDLMIRKTLKKARR